MTFLINHTGNADDENGIDDIEKGGSWIGLKQGNGAKEKEESATVANCVLSPSSARIKVKAIEKIGNPKEI